MTDTQRRSVAGFEIAGGGWILAVALLLASPATAAQYALLATTLAAAALSVAAGALLWRGRVPGYRLSILAQALQLPTLGTSAVVYELGFGLHAYVGIKPPWSLVAGASPGGAVTLTLHPATFAPLVGVNVVALTLLVLLLREVRVPTGRGPAPAA